LPAPSGLGMLNMWLAMPLIIVSTLMVMKLTAFGAMKENVSKQFAIFSNKHTWSLTILYIVTFGSFIGFSMALPLSMKVIFGVSHVPDANGILQHTLVNPKGPPVLAYAWIGPFVGAAIRPVGGWISDKLGGSIVTQWVCATMAVAGVAVGYVMQLAYQSAHPEEYFFIFLALFIVLFAASGIGNGSTFRMIPVIFLTEAMRGVDKHDAAAVANANKEGNTLGAATLGFTAAMAAYGGFFIPKSYGSSIALTGSPHAALWTFFAFYLVCIVITWWYYGRKNAEMPC